MSGVPGNGREVDQEAVGSPKDVPFYDQPKWQAPLRYLDGWGYVEMGAGSKLTATYSPLHTVPSNQTWPEHAVMLHAAVDGFLVRLGRPKNLTALLRHRYPRSLDPTSQGVKQLGIHHRNSIGSFLNPAAIEKLKQSWGAEPWEMEEFLKRREREFIRALPGWIKRHG
jgi:hypothetical protein